MSLADLLGDGVRHQRSFDILGGENIKYRKQLVPGSIDLEQPWPFVLRRLTKNYAPHLAASMKKSVIEFLNAMIIIVLRG